MKIKIFSMGGTIDKLYFDDLSRYEVGDPQVVEVLKEAEVHFDYDVEDVVRKDSLRLTEADREILRQRIAASPHRLALVTHGTDTMVETGQALKGIPDKVIVLTGALSPYRFRQSDATFNIGCAIGALQVLPPGVYIAMSGRVFAIDRVRKNREARRFEEIP
jgi:L-asparaginase